MPAALEGLDKILKSLSYSLLNYGRVVVYKDKGGARDIQNEEMCKFWKDRALSWGVLTHRVMGKCGTSGKVGLDPGSAPGWSQGQGKSLVVKSSFNSQVVQERSNSGERCALCKRGGERSSLVIPQFMLRTSGSHVCLLG